MNELGAAAFICLLPNGHRLYRRPSSSGGFVYLSDADTGVPVWDTGIFDPATLLAALLEESRREREELHAAARDEPAPAGAGARRRRWW